MLIAARDPGCRSAMRSKSLILCCTEEDLLGDRVPNFWSVINIEHLQLFIVLGNRHLIFFIDMLTYSNLYKTTLNRADRTVCETVCLPSLSFCWRDFVAPVLQLRLLFRPIPSV